MPRTVTTGRAITITLTDIEEDVNMDDVLKGVKKVCVREINRITGQEVLVADEKKAKNDGKNAKVDKE